MESEQRTLTFPQEEVLTGKEQQSAPGLTGSLAGAARDQTSPTLKGTVAKPWQERLDELGFKPGSTFVYRVKGKLYAWGDFTHCPAEDIVHNIRSLAERLRKEQRLWGVGKAFDADIYRLEQAGDWNRVRWEVGEIYKERMHLVGDDGSLTPVEDPVEEKKDEREVEPERSHIMEQQTKFETRKNGHTPAANLPAANGGALDILWDGLPPKVVEELSKTLEQALVSYRKGRGGRSFAYVEGHTAIAQANRVFGYGGWGYEAMGDVACREVRSVDGKTGEVKTTLMYCATVKVIVPGVPPRTDVGCQPVAEETAEGHDTAYKGAVTDALKRALRSFGDQFGNALYGDGNEDTLTPALKDSLMELGRAQGLSPERLREAVRKRTGKDMDSLLASELAPLVQAMAKKLQAPANNRSTTNAATPSR